MIAVLDAVLLAERAGWGPGTAGGGPWWPVFPIVWGLFWVGLIVTAVVLLWRRGSADTRAGRAALAERFARGDIDEQEYADRVAVLRRTRRRTT